MVILEVVKDAEYKNWSTNLKFSGIENFDLRFEFRKKTLYIEKISLVKKFHFFL